MSSTHSWHTYYTLILGLVSSVYYNFAIDSALSCYQRKLARIIFVIFKLLKYKRLAQIIAIPQALTSSLYREDLVYPGKASETHTLTVNRYRETITSIKIIKLFDLYNMLSDDTGTVTASWSARWGRRNWRIMPWWVSQRSFFTIIRRC